MRAVCDEISRSTRLRRDGRTDERRCWTAAGPMDCRVHVVRRRAVQFANLTRPRKWRRSPSAGNPVVGGERAAVKTVMEWPCLGPCDVKARIQRRHLRDVRSCRNRNSCAVVSGVYETCAGELNKTCVVVGLFRSKQGAWRHFTPLHVSVNACF